jgi:uncharacterized protein (UPF0548 family)
VRFALAGSGAWHRSLAWWRERERTDDEPGVLRADHHEVDVAVPAGTSADEVFERLRERLVTYQHFPVSTLKARVDAPDGCVRDGSLVVQRVFVPFLPIALEAGVRVTEVWDRADGDVREAGMAIVTLDGHPEIGRERFAVRLDRVASRVTFTIDVESRAGPVLVRLARPIARWFQLRATRALLRSMSRS